MATTDNPVRMSTPPKRKLRNFLLDARFQLKYTGMVVAVTVVVASVLGYFAYDYSVGQSESMTAEMAMQPDLDPSVANSLASMAAQQDREVLIKIVGGIFVMALMLGITGIVITHRMAGPAFKIRRLLREVAAGDLTHKHGLRKGDELKEVFDAFSEMVESLRERERADLEALTKVLAVGHAGPLDAATLATLEKLRDRMRSSLGDPPGGESV